MKNKQDQNALDFIPTIKEAIKWSCSDEDIVTVEHENKGPFNWVAQKVFHRPRTSFITLESYGSFIWMQIDGTKTIYDIAMILKAEYGQEANPLYERLLTYFRTLKDHGFIDIN